MILRKRLMTTAVITSLIAWILFYTNDFWFTILTLAFVGTASFEFFTLLRKSGAPVYRLFGVSMGMMIPVVIYLEQGLTQSGEVLAIVLGCLFLFLLQFYHKNNAQALVGIALTLFGILYVSWFLSFVLKLRFMESGPIWLAYILVVTKMSDSGAYLIGTWLGRHPLIPHISPKKSVEGLVGGICFSVAASVCFRPVLPVPFSLPHLLLMGFLIGVVGQVGDLSESLMKRSCGAKDSGNLLPGMGGSLDAIDSILFTVPIFYYHLKIFLGP